MIGLFQVPDAGIPYISAMDSALAEGSDLLEYLKTFDPKYQRVVPGKVPTKFYLRRLSLKQWEGVRLLPAAQQDRAAVAYAVVNVENFVTGSGAALVPERIGEGEEKRLSWDTLSAMYSPALFKELGSAIVILSGLDPLAGAR